MKQAEVGKALASSAIVERWRDAKGIPPYDLCKLTVFRELPRNQFVRELAT